MHRERGGRARGKYIKRGSEWVRATELLWYIYCFLFSICARHNVFKIDSIALCDVCVSKNVWNVFERFVPNEQVFKNTAKPTSKAEPHLYGFVVVVEKPFMRHTNLSNTLNVIGALLHLWLAMACR